MYRIQSTIKIFARAQLFRLSNISASNYSKATMSSETVLTNLKSVFSCGVSAVQPKNIFRAENVSINSVKSTIDCNFNGELVSIDFSGNKRCHLVGFGKAVYGLASELCKVLNERLESGIISVPLNIQKTFSEVQLPPTIKIFEGAKNNLPDEAAQLAAGEIVEFTKKFNKNDILFVLVSGGGSALLPLPCNGVSLREKSDIIKKLASKGATIADINRVRIDLSQTKGGKLAHCARNAGAVITFIISDIIGDPIHLIASGPTVISSQNPEDEEHSIDVLKRFALWDSLPEHNKKAISEHMDDLKLSKVENVRNIIIASNEFAVNAMLREVTKNGVKGIILSTAVEGNVADISEAYFDLCKSIQNFKNDQIDESQFLQQLVKLRQMLRMRESFLENIVQMVNESKNEQIDLCVIGAGEPTVHVTGNGIGGRNQELALRFSQLSFPDNMMQDVLILSAGTDGIDGKWQSVGFSGPFSSIFIQCTNRLVFSIHFIFRRIIFECF